MNKVVSKNNLFLSFETWVFIFLTIFSVCLLFKFVDLTPQVNYHTFFSSEDPNYKADVEISRLFPRNDDQILISISGDIQSATYQQKMKKIGNLILDLELVTDLKSIVSGPKSVKAAIKSPFWQRLLISNGGKSSNMLITLKPGSSVEQLSKLITKIENIKKIFNSSDFKVHLSGFPYIVDLIRRHLNTDLKMFSLLAFAVFGVIIIIVFHSLRILIGMIITCVNTAAITLMVSNYFNIKIGILTANLTTIVFVLTLSHIVFLTYNWKHLYNFKDKNQAANEAVRITWPASFWAMITTLFGFISLLSVPAKPIRELGASGAIGTAIAFLMVYCIYPAFLRLQAPLHEKSDDNVKRIFTIAFKFFEKNRSFVLISIFGIVLFTATELSNLNLDPSLISFFSQKSNITEGLKYIDKHGGSNPLIAVVKSKTGDPLDSKESLAHLWKLHKEFEENDDVGTVISLPLIVNEARHSNFFSFMYSNKKLINVMEKPAYNSIAEGFITKDRKYALFLFRMNEEGRKDTRLAVIKKLSRITENNNMKPHLFGGIYALQGNLSKHVSKSLIYGLVRLILILTIIALLTSHSFGITIGMTFSISLVPLCVLGIIGTLKIPMDIIAAPASNIAISMGIDAMIHMTHTYKRLKKQNLKTKNTWLMVREKLWEPIMTSMIIVSSGFGIFFFSLFPPTQRFGGSIVLGTIIPAFSALFVFPLFASDKEPKIPKTKKPKTPKEEAKDILHLAHLSTQSLSSRNKIDRNNN
ncbi:MAG: MMPL family transporter [Candidatus Omnitrophica bacterium]|nr:MMPL family transporter [Candidatus Omnitrophota bacterium]